MFGQSTVNEKMHSGFIETTAADLAEIADRKIVRIHCGPSVGAIREIRSGF
jgi:hypothetical protein